MFREVHLNYNEVAFSLSYHYVCVVDDAVMH